MNTTLRTNPKFEQLMVDMLHAIKLKGTGTLKYDLNNRPILNDFMVQCFGKCEISDLALGTLTIIHLLQRKSREI